MSDVEQPATIDDLMKFVGSGDSKYMFRVAVNFIRLVSQPAFGPHAYSTVFVRGFWGYGKNQQFKSSEEARQVLEDRVKKFLYLCSKCEIVIWRGCTGIGYPIKDTEEKFWTEFNESNMRLDHHHQL